MCISAIMVGILFGQEADTVEIHPCDSPLLEQMKGNEKRPLKLRQMLPYTINVIKCRFSERGKNAANIRDVRNKKMAYKDAQQFKSFSSTCAYCAAVMVFVFYLSTIF
jgi:hypothetical protein|tara:strand:+ start:450 stop:773 length:324 start_codon:yes stop_codon:yes gene_type:complete